MRLVARSFDINKPGSTPEKLIGGVLGGAVKRGSFKVGDEIDIAPEKIFAEKPRSLSTKIVSLMSGTDEVKDIKPGGSVAILTSLDPSLISSDGLSGTVVGLKGKLPPVWHEFNLKVHLLERVVGSKDEEEVKPIAEKEMLMLNVNSAATVGVIEDLKKGIAFVKLKIPVCAEKGSRVTISRKLGNRFRLVGYGIIQ
jgi:translation initiation factor 2 subunit 3